MQTKMLPSLADLFCIEAAHTDEPTVQAARVPSLDFVQYATRRRTLELLPTVASKHPGEVGKMPCQ